MSKRTRQYLGILAALGAYYLVHEGAHLLCALVTGVFKQIHFMGLGVQIDICAQDMTDMQLAIFCLTGPLATLLAGYLLTLFTRKICRWKNALLRAAAYYTTIALLCPEWAARCFFGALLFANGLVFRKQILPAYQLAFQNSPTQ